MKFEERRTASREIYRGRVVHLFEDRIELPDGTPSTREYCRHPGAVAVVPVRENGNVIMVRQFRYPFHTDLLEIPAGKLDAGEDWLECAKRELSEETGCSARDWVPLGEFYSSCAILDETIHLYLATGLSDAQMHPDSDEFLELEEYPLDTLIDMVMRDEIRDGKSQAALLKAKRYLDGNA